MIHLLSSIDINKYFNYKPRCNGVYSRDNLPRIKDGPHVINLDDKKSKVTHWISLFIDRIRAVYFDSFGIEYIPQEILNKTKNKSITYNIFRNLEYNLMILLCVDFIVSLS